MIAEADKRSLFAVTDAALNAPLRLGETLDFRCKPPHAFRVAREIVKRQAELAMAFDKSAQNFTAMESRELIAHDGAMPDWGEGGVCGVPESGGG